MGEMIAFPSNGSVGQGYLVSPPGGGPGVVAIQESWGLVPRIKDVCDRFAAEGFTALAPDLYRGKQVSEPDEDHAFFKDTRPEVYDAAASALAWQRTLDFMRSDLS